MFKLSLLQSDLCPKKIDPTRRLRNPTRAVTQLLSTFPKCLLLSLSLCPISQRRRRRKVNERRDKPKRDFCPVVFYSFSPFASDHLPSCILVKIFYGMCTLMYLVLDSNFKGIFII